MRIKFIKDTKDARPDRSGTFSKGKVKIIADEYAKKYIDKGNALDVDGNYVKKEKIKKDGEE